MGELFYKILSVDDSESNRVLIEMYLEDHPYSVTCASNGYSALKYFENDVYDCILMDVEMPGINGFEVVEKIRTIESQRDTSETPVIFLTAHDLRQFKDDVEKIRHSKIFGKPLRRVDLLRAIEQFVSGKGVKSEDD